LYNEQWNDLIFTDSGKFCAAFERLSGSDFSAVSPFVSGDGSPPRPHSPHSESSLSFSALFYETLWRYCEGERPVNRTAGGPPFQN